MDKIAKFIDLPLRHHIVAGAVVRLILIIYGDYHDRAYDVPYTDVDYRVFTDAARHVLAGQSPYKRHTYRYSPVIAYLLVPNIIFGRNFGKILFSMFDILITIAVKVLVENQLGSKTNATKIATYCAFFWLYNPLSIGISTRGNADSVSCFFIVMSVLYLLTDLVKGSLKYALSGVLLGISIHLRLYPVAFSFPMYLCLGEYKINRNTRIRDGLYSLLPNRKQIILSVSCVSTLIGITYVIYLLYGYEFLFETYIYHVIRKDTRHNFSVLFYYLYLTADLMTFDVVKTLTNVLECLTLLVISLTFGCDRTTLPFALFCQAVVLVAYNSVMTSQYFVWFLSLLPLVVHSFKMVPAKAVLLAIIWFSAQGAWLFYAYLLEFKGREVFILIWLKGVVFFCANIYVLGQLVRCYTPGYGFGFGQVDPISETKTKQF